MGVIQHSHKYYSASILKSQNLVALVIIEVYELILFKNMLQDSKTAKQHPYRESLRLSRSLCK